MAAPTKTLRFRETVLDELRNMAWEEEGRLGKIERQLDRKLYQELNKALEAMGGKWNRKSQGHVFAFDPRPAVEGLIETGTIKVEKDGFFRTPGSVMREMLKLVPIGDRGIVTILEPSAGDGAIVDVLLKSGVMPGQIWCIEKNARRCAVLRTKAGHVGCGDFMAFKNSANFHWARIYMNPPFEERQDIIHLWKAYTLLAPGGKLVSVMSEGTFFREDRTSENFRLWLKAAGGQSIKLPEKSFHESGTDVNTRLVVLEKKAQDANENLD